MSYRLQVPTSYNTAGLRAALASTACDVRMGIGIDSRTALDASNCPVWHGIIRTWDVPWSGILCRAASLGSAFWASGGFSNTNFAAARAILRPDQANSAAIADIAPTQILDYPFSGDAPTLSASPYMQQFLTGWGSAVRGNPWASQQTIARIPWYRHAGGVTTVRFRSYRKTGTDASPTYNNVATPSSVSMAGADGWQFTDMDCGAGTDDPGCGLIEGGTAVVETGTRMLVGPVSYYRGTAGNRTTGFCLAPWGVGGYCTLDTVRQWGGDGANAYSTTANAAWFLANAMFAPNYQMLCGAGQNSTNPLIGTDPAEQTQLNAGDQTNYYNNIRAIIDAMNAAYDAAALPRPTYILVNDFRTGYTATHHETRGRALYRIAQEIGSIFIDLYQLALNSPAIWTPDNIHLTGPTTTNYSFTVGSGADYMAATMWNEIMNPNQTFRVRGRFR